MLFWARISTELQNYALPDIGYCFPLPLLFYVQIQWWSVFYSHITDDVICVIFLQMMWYVLYFTDDVICVIFRCNTSCYTWESLMLAVLMTVAYVRHCSDGRMCAEYIRNLLEGLRCVIQRLDNSKHNLGGWVSKRGVLITTDPY